MAAQLVASEEGLSSMMVMMIVLLGTTRVILFY
jgi:hypothetical protein